MGGRKPSQLIGLRYGRLLVLSRAGFNAYGTIRWKCICDCGAEKIVETGGLSTGSVRSCGCLRRDATAQRFTKHGATKGRKWSPEFSAWQGMLGRCSDHSKNFLWYGARGISVCPRWQESFENFLADMGERPSSRHSLDRINNDGNYEPSNCRWATTVEQGNNRGNNHYLTYKGVEMTLTQAIRSAGNIVDGPTCRYRIRRGWPVDAAVETPPTRNGRRSVHTGVSP